jgi:hypothetical protein
MLLESYEHAGNCFVTLTYDEEHLPENGWLNKKHLQLFLKKLRSRISPLAIRFYAVGEYGDLSWRPHFHLVLFGISPLESKLVQDCWPYGFTFTGTAEPKSMSYVAQYVVKKMNNPKDSRLAGRPPEFCTMSLKPGIGSGLISRVVKAVNEHPSTVPLLFDTVRANGFKYPLGKYLKSQLDTALGVLPESRRIRLRAHVAELFDQKIRQTTETIEAERRAKVVASLGRVNLKKGTL